MLGNILKLMRIVNSLTLKEAGIKMGVSIAFIQAVETEDNPKIGTIKMFANAYNIPVGNLLLIEEEASFHNLNEKEILNLIFEYYQNKLRNEKNIILENVSNESNKKSMLGKVLKLMRIVNSFTIEEASFEIDISSQYVCMLESEKRVPRFKTLKKIANAYNIPVGNLLLIEEEASVRNLNEKEILNLIFEYYQNELKKDSAQKTI